MRTPSLVDPDAITQANAEFDRLHKAEMALQRATEIAERYGSIDGPHHKAWVLDQMVRALTGEGYAAWVAAQRADGGRWDEGIHP